MKLKHKINISFVIIGLVVSQIMFWQIYISAKKSLESYSFDKLTAIRETKKERIINYFEMVEKQALSFAETPWIIKAAISFHDVFSQNHAGIKLTDRMGAEIKEYYENFLLSQDIASESAGDLQPDDPIALRLQYQYIVSKPDPSEFSNTSAIADNDHEYSKEHQSTHPKFRTLINRFGFSDLFLVDQEGYITYSVQKKIDFATNLLNGPHKKSNISDAYRQIKTNMEKGDLRTVLVDFKHYLPSSNAPAAFIAVPIFARNQWIGCLILQLSITEINMVMTNNSNWLKDGLGKTGETYLVGPDYKMRNDSRFLIETPEAFRKDLADYNIDESVISGIFRFRTTVLFQEVRTKASHDALAGKTLTRIVRDYRNIPVLSSYSPLNIMGLNWAILSEINVQEAFSSVQNFKWNAVGTMFVLTLAIIGFGILFSVNINRGFSQLMHNIKKIEQSDFNARIQVETRDEFQEIADRFNQMAHNLSLTTASRQELILEIKQRKRAEKALKESENKYRMIFENSVVGIYLSSPKGQFINVNNAFSKMLGYNSPEDLVTSISDISSQVYVNPEDRLHYRQTLEEQGYIENFEFNARCRDGTHITLLNSARVYFDNNEEVLHYEGINIDITNRKRLEKEREDLIKDLKGAIAKINMLEGLVPICSHCKSVRDDKGYWNRIESYLNLVHGSDLSHGICPDCATKYYPDIEIYNEDEKKMVNSTMSHYQ